MPVLYQAEHFCLLCLTTTQCPPLRSAGSREPPGAAPKSSLHSPISRFRSFVVQLWKNSVIKLSNARSEASSDAWGQHRKKGVKVNFHFESRSLLCTADFHGRQRVEVSTSHHAEVLKN